MNQKPNTKDDFRALIKSLKAEYTSTQLEEMSEEVFSVVEITGFFQDAKSIFIYNSLPDEVSTHRFIEKWATEKNIFLPVIEGDKLVFKRYTDSSKMQIGVLGIQEPIGELGMPKANDLIIVPGMAFDRKMNRLGRGKGYYDKFLSSSKGLKMGVCFDFQLLDSVPTEDFDVKMDVLVSENDLIW